ncbi:SDR family oxidoreductase [Kushneria phosphatilytica]|uniref:SDR family oxidoreductase n=1 Tax=Kushneria phosphatilytica TaxID=657387 RepID=A0A1S1NT33_9GAMM|nr:SDR family oxidoreductase [Kushneria phosphatilytica]OHV08452.1 NAD(P)-dependent oxidoreductase [Kushneria phosphatilytica]QEL09880.1 SDR family oxidoreductase [Kushneria phosphatilytica]
MADERNPTRNFDKPQVTDEPKPPYPKQRQRQPGHGLESEMEPLPRYLSPRYKAAGKLEGKVALITGGDSGIGRAVAVLYAREGADVAIVYLPDEQPDADEARQAVENEGRRCLQIPGDLSEQSFCQEAIERTVSELGDLNIMVSNAAYLNSKQSLEEMTAEDWDRTFKVNAYAYFYLVQASLPHLKEGDAIIATISEEAMKGSRVMIDYAASKAAMVGYTKSIAPHLAERGIRINMVAPGPTWTSLNVADQGMPMERIHNLGDEKAQSTMFQRGAQPEEMAPTYVYLASDADSSFTMGELIAVTGGITATR